MKRIFLVMVSLFSLSGLIQTTLASSLDHIPKEARLHIAAQKNDHVLAEALLSEGVPANFRDPSGWTPLHTAALSGSYCVAKLLIEKNADVNATVRGMKTTPLMEAANNGHSNLVLLLLKNGAEHNLMDKDRFTAAAYASNPKLIEILSLESPLEYENWKQVIQDYFYSLEALSRQ